MSMASIKNMCRPRSDRKIKNPNHGANQKPTTRVVVRELTRVKDSLPTSDELLATEGGGVGGDGEDAVPGSSGRGNFEETTARRGRRDLTAVWRMRCRDLVVVGRRRWWWSS